MLKCTVKSISEAIILTPLSTVTRKTTMAKYAACHTRFLQALWAKRPAVCSAGRAGPRLSMSQEAQAFYSQHDLLPQTVGPHSRSASHADWLLPIRCSAYRI